MRDRVLAQRVGIGLDGKRRAAREADAAMIAGAGIAVDTEALAHYRSEEHTSELQSLMRISYAVFCLKKKKYPRNNNTTHNGKNRATKLHATVHHQKIRKQTIVN